MKEITMYVVRDKTDKSLFKGNGSYIGCELSEAKFYSKVGNANKAIAQLYASSKANAEVVPVKITVLK